MSSHAISLGVLLLLSGCAQSSIEATNGDPAIESPRGDGVLDCDSGQVEILLDVNVSGSSAAEVATQALDSSARSGALAAATSDPDVWSISENNSEVAIAYVESSDSQSWFSNDVRKCGEPEVSTEPQKIDGEIDCLGTNEWLAEALVDPTIPGLATPEEAIEASLGLLSNVPSDARIEIIGGSAGTLVTADREVVRVDVTEVEAGGWVVEVTEGCAGFEYK